jgi:vancomycin resistance protein YoaR
MSQQAPASDDTVRFRGDAPDRRPPLDGPRPAAGSPPVPAQDGPPAEHPTEHPTEHPAERPTGSASNGRGPEPSGEVDDTRPVTRDWLQGAPDAGESARPTPSGPPSGQSPATPPSGPPAAAASQAAGRNDDDTARFVPDDVLTGPAPERAAEPSVDEDDFGTQKFDVIETEPTPEAQPESAPAPVPPSGSDAAQRGPGGRTRTSGSDSLPPLGEEPPSGPRGPWWRRKAVLVPAGVLTLLALAYGIDLGVASGIGNIPRSTVVAGVDIGGLSPAAAADKLQHELAPVVSADHAVVAADVETTFSPVAAGLELDVDGTVEAADDQPLNPWTRLVTLVGDRAVEPVIASDDTALTAQLETIAAQVDRAPVDATIAFEGTTPNVVDAADGRAMDQDGAADSIVEALAAGQDPETAIELPVDITPVRVDRTEAERVLEETVLPAVSAPVAVVSADGATSAEVPVAAIAASLVFTPEETGELQVTIDPAALQTALGDELSAFGTPAKDAGFEVSGAVATVVPSVDGTGVDPAQLAEQLLPVLVTPAPRSVTAELGPVPADFTTEEAQALGIKEQISSFTTRFTSQASGTNMRVVAAKVDGALIRPGETFSLNTFTGPRGTAQGYVEAAVIQNGELSKAVGGGISQFATTMFNAVFFAGLEDVYHKPHTFYISRYPAGREATVYEGVIDLQWRNDSDTGVYVDTAWTPGSLTVTFYGTKHFEIEAIEGPRTNHRQPTVQEKVDDGTCTPQPGIPGFDVTVTRVFRDLTSGQELRRETFHTRYAAEAVIHCIPPAEPAPTPTPEGTPPGG